MAYFCEKREALLLPYDLNIRKNLDYSHWNYDRFDLDNWTDEKCKIELRFYK